MAVYKYSRGMNQRLPGRNTAGAHAVLLVFEKFTRAYLFQIALEIMCLHLIAETLSSKKAKTKMKKPNRN